MKVSKETIIRTVVLALALINQILTSCGKSPLPFESDTVTELVSNILTIAASVWAWWKNNSFTENAIKSDNYLKDLNSKN